AAQSMFVVLVHPSLKLFVRALNSLARLGDELYLEFDTTGVLAKTVNSGRSAYAEFAFQPEFFHRHCLADASDRPEESLRCKIPVKAYRQTFRSLGHIDRSVERCRIELDGPARRLTVQFQCRMGISKLHQLYVLECECLQAVVPLPTGRFTRLSIRPKLLADLVMQNFQTSQEELTVTCQPRACVICSYCDNGVPAAGSVQTSLSLRPDEFHEYRPSGSKGVTFCQRELRCLLMFGDWQAPASFPLEIEFERPGRPVQFHYHCPEMAFEGRYVLSTLAEPQSASATGRSAGPISDTESELTADPGSQLTVTTSSLTDGPSSRRQRHQPASRNQKRPAAALLSPSPTSRASQSSSGPRSAVLENLPPPAPRQPAAFAEEEEEDDEGDETIGPEEVAAAAAASASSRGGRKPLLSMLQADSPEQQPDSPASDAQQQPLWSPHSPVFGGPPPGRFADRRAAGGCRERQRRPPAPLSTSRILVPDSDGED
ncbi:hypothetical protein BOX15_Mlig006463g1, partial [Macrostomum lignano]